MKSLGAKNLKLKTNSKLVVRQITNEYEVKEERMKRYLKQTTQFIFYFDDIRLEQVPGKENSEADEVAKLASSNDNTKRLGLYMEVQRIPIIEWLLVF